MPEKVTARALEIARLLMEKLGLIGVLCIEFFLTRDHEILVNELAPRPHNSGHLTINASHTSQFEQQLRAVCGLPLGSTEYYSAAAMANLLGDLWQNGEPNWTRACDLPDVKLHLYGKIEPRPGRKMGHLTALAKEAEEAGRRVIEARQRLTG
jgi:5-(carboxyamino)imidazole ribonucleotide synthase